MIIEKTSPSDLETYSYCPYCWFLKHDGHRQAPTEAMKFGTRLHSAVKKYHRDGEFLFAEDLQEYLDLYMEQNTRDFETCEEMWEVPLFDTGILFRMKLDLVKDDALTEHKTSARPYSQAYVDTLRQLTAYSWAWGQLYLQREKEIKVNVFLTNPQPEDELIQTFITHRTAADWQIWEQWVRLQLRGIEQDEFEPNPKGRFHNFPECPFYKETEL
jgi:CRISPR/Cas system-associated exonuclease Cas4 (RecB family)